MQPPAPNIGGLSADQFEKLASALDVSGTPTVARADATASPQEFSKVLSQMVRDVEAKQAQANMATQGVLSGNGVPLHQAVLASEEASVAFQLMVEVRNKLLESYQELMRMQV